MVCQIAARANPEHSNSHLAAKDIGYVPTQIVTEYFRRVFSAGLRIILTSAVSFFVLRQAFDLAAWIGMGLIVAGVAVMNVFFPDDGLLIRCMLFGRAQSALSALRWVTDHSPASLAPVGQQ